MHYLLIDLALAALILLARFFLFQLVLVKGRSMLSTLENGQVLFVTLPEYRFRTPRRHEIVICHYPGRMMKKIPFMKENFVKRVVGLPGETVEIVEGVVHIDGQPLEEPFLDPLHTRFHGSRPPVTLGPEEFFVMGDNRDNSNDSRRVGPIRRSEISGHVRCILWPFRKARRLH